MKNLATVTKVVLPDWKSLSVSQILQALIFTVLLYIVVFMYQGSESSKPKKASTWIVLRELAIPDHKIGEEKDTPIVYAREILKPFNGLWHTETQQVVKDGLIGVRRCDAKGVIPYSPEKVLQSTVTLGWLLDIDKDGKASSCDWVDPNIDSFEPGAQYRTCLTIEILQDNSQSIYTEPLCSHFYTKFK